jgi:hypothetical protein
MRRAVGVLLMLLGFLLLVGGSWTAALLGPDGRTFTGQHPLDTDAKALVTAPGVLGWAGPTVTVDVTVVDEQPVFVGVGNTVDVLDYLAETDRLVVTDLRIPWRMETERVPGRPYVPAAPTAVDWWIASGAGQGGARTSFALPEESASVAVVALGETDLSGAALTSSYDVKGGFGLGLGAAGLGVGLGLFGWVAFRGPAPDWEEVDAWDEYDDEEPEHDGAEPDEDAAGAGAPDPQRRVSS